MQLTVHVNIKRVLDGYTEQLKRRADTALNVGKGSLQEHEEHRE